MKGRRNWFPCRVCGAEHTNPMSSSICSPCGAAEREASERAKAAEARLFEESSFGQFMNLSEGERWLAIFERLEALEGQQ